MKFNNGFIGGFIRLFLLFFAGIFLIGAGYGVLFSMEEGWQHWWPLTAGALFFEYMVLTSLWDCSDTELDEHGATIRFLGVKHRFPWDTIRQTVILEQFGRETGPSLVLVTARGRPLVPGGLVRWFLRRNAFRLVRIPHDEEAEAYIRRYYGGIDYDRSMRSQ